MDNEKQQLYRHSMAHVLAAAVKKVYGDNVKFGIGPAIDKGFYYDFDIDKNITPESFDDISKAMDEIISSNIDMVCQTVSKQQAREIFADQPYKIQLIDELPDDEDITIYSLGDAFVDLCRGPHVENTKYLRGFSYKIDKVAGAYWKGSEKNKMLQRIYVYGFLDKKELKEHLLMLEEAKKRDHRKIGKELDLFFISEYAKGMPFFLEKGLILKNTLIEYWREVHKKSGYIEIETPQCMNRSLWEVSGHWAHYKDNMYSFGLEDDVFALKPMNCPGGMIVYNESIHSYKELPLRVGELGKVHRHEASGTLSGLFRVRTFTQDDAHIFMLESQIEDEIINVMKLIDEVYSVFGLSYHVELSTMPEDHIGEIETWQIAEQKLINALKRIDKDYILNEGDGAFYGPKIDIHVKDAIGRTWQCGTIQLDMQLPERFDLNYIDEDGTKKRPVMIHRVVFGAIERMMGVLIEHFAGAFPLWLSPVQVKVLNISESNEGYAKNVYNQLLDAGIRAEIDIRNEKIGYKIREATKKKTPYMIIVGDNEMNDSTISIRGRGNEEHSGISLSSFIDRIKDEINTKKL